MHGKEMKTQREKVYAYIVKSLKKGKSPSFAEIGEALGLTRGGAQWHVDNLIGDNVFKRDKNKLLVEIKNDNGK